MMVSLGLYVRRWQRQLRRWMLDPRLHALAQAIGYLLGGFLFSAASLGAYAQPLTLGLLSALAGWPAVLLTMGGVAGYMVFWGMAGTQGVVWLACGLVVAILLGGKPILRDTTLLMPAITALITAATGLGFQVWLADTTPVGIYILRIAVAGLSSFLFALATERRDPVVEWAVSGLGVLALAQVMPIPYIGLGYIAAGVLVSAGAFPAAALAGLALDLAQVTPVPMTAAVCLGWLLRLIPGMPKKLLYGSGGMMYLLVMGLCNLWDLYPLPGLVIGGVIALFLPEKPGLSHRRGETGFAQVRLEMAAAVLRQSEQLLADMEDIPIDEEALIGRAVDRACGSCTCRKNCREQPENLPISLLHKPLGNGADLPLHCRKSGRMLQELRRSQEQLRSIRADRDRQTEYRAAVVQQYQFLSDYLQDLSDVLSRRATPPKQVFQPELAVCSAGRGNSNGDRCLWFAGVECRYYILLCDGMGTGPEAAREGKNTAAMVKKLLCSGYPPEYALRSVNSLCTLQGRGGAVTIDLAELRLDTGKVAIYKWGAAPSYVVSRGDAVKIGTAAPPPGLSVTDGRETVERLSLRRGELLVLQSDGAGGEEALRAALEGQDLPPGELAAQILSCSEEDRTDDATVAVVRLNPLTAST